ncbi:MAG: DUF664 domain-containing protein [Chloroflexales bacterium]|nr:DUF664 domain-containing protein [Chloroflexales bacterium]
MISPAQMADAFNRNVQIIKMQTRDLTHEESLLQLPFRANCMNWVVGHIVSSRNGVLRLLGEEPAIAPEVAARYARDAQPISGLEAAVAPLADLLAALEEGQARLGAALAAAGDEALGREVNLYGGSARPTRDWIFFLYFHDTFHVGETSVLRQAAGKDDKVI